MGAFWGRKGEAKRASSITDAAPGLRICDKASRLIPLMEASRLNRQEYGAGGPVAKGSGTTSLEMAESFWAL